MHYQHGPRQHYGLAAPCVSMHHSISAGNHSNLLTLPQSAAQDTASSGADRANRAHPAQFQETNRSHLLFSGSLYLTPRGPLGRTLVLWQTCSNQQNLKLSAAEEPFQCVFSNCIFWRCTSRLAVLKAMAHSWQPQHAAPKESGRNRASLRVMLLRRMPHYRGKMRNSYLFS